jgi:hypothetical protein
MVTEGFVGRIGRLGEGGARDQDEAAVQSEDGLDLDHSIASGATGDAAARSAHSPQNSRRHG